MGADIRVIKPQAGPQERFAASPADIAIYGGAAGGGKSWALLLEPLRHVTTTPDFAAVFFRRNTTQVRNPGGLWDASAKLYPIAGGRPVQHVLEWVWPKGGKVKFAHLEHESTVYDWQGAEVPLICFDELTHFTKSQFFYLLSRNRTMSGVRPYVRATCNPDADSWVAEFIGWWIDQETGLPIPDRSGVVRWFVRVNDVIAWGASDDELRQKFGAEASPKSVTFIAAKLSDNQALMQADPGYLANLRAQNSVERARLELGNWKVRPSAGMYFKRQWVRVIDAAPIGLEEIRFWDLAATEKTEMNDPDWTVGVRMGVQRDADRRIRRIVVFDARRMQESPLKVEQAIANTSSADGQKVKVGFFQDPGQAGKAQAASLVRMLSKAHAKAYPISGDKVTLFGPFSAQCEAGNVEFVRGSWNDAVFTQLEGFPDLAHDDDADACSGGFNALAGGFAIAAQTMNAPGL
jgi:predicted phage terminase large subunit-like protein